MRLDREYRRAQSGEDDKPAEPISIVGRLKELKDGLDAKNKPKGGVKNA